MKRDALAGSGGDRRSMARELESERGERRRRGGGPANMVLFPIVLILRVETGESGPVRSGTDGYVL